MLALHRLSDWILDRMGFPVSIDRSPLINQAIVAYPPTFHFNDQDAIISVCNHKIGFTILDFAFECSYPTYRVENVESIGKSGKRLVDFTLGAPFWIR